MKNAVKSLLIAATLAALSAPVSACYSEGVRSGVIQKFSKKGFINKSWEGELVMDGLKAKKSGAITNVWKFSVTDPEVAKVIEQAAFPPKEVALKYCQQYFTLGASDTPYLVTGAAIQ